MSKNRIGLIVQGPVISTGIRGSLLREKNYVTDQNSTHLIEYNCLENILDIGKSANSIFDEVVLSTWNSNYLHSLNKSNLFDKVIASSEEDFENLYIKNNVFIQNYKKQFHTLHVASEYLKTKKLDFIVKIRTDLKVDIDKLYKECLIAINNNQTLVNNELRSPSRFLEIDDFIFGCESNLFTDWMDNLVKIDFGKPAGAHSNLMVSYLWTKYQSKTFLKNLHFFHKSVENNSKKISNLAIEEWGNFYILTKDFWLNSKLRGEELDRRYYDFKKCKPKIKKHKINYDFNAYMKWFKTNYNILSNVK